jgi:diamine N-acetyltransferase
VELRDTTGADLDFVLGAESDPEASRYVTVETREQHEAIIADPNQRHLIVADGPSRLGYLVLRGVEDPHGNLEIRRIVIVDRGRGTGREALRMAVDLAFREHEPHRVWLDVLPQNERAIRAYLAVGFVHEGVLREAWRGEHGHESLAIMSILEREWDVGPD